MNKSKLGVMLVTFLILIAITPIVFKKLMNSKLDTMILELNQHGYQIKEIKNESSYLTTKRYFDIKIPGKVINESIKWVEFQGFITFKNLPVTSVLMRGTLIDGKAQKYIQEVIEVLKNKFTLNVTTPNFKVFKFKADDISEKDLVLKGFNGIYSKDELIYSFKLFKYKNDEIYDASVNSKRHLVLVKASLKEEKVTLQNIKLRYHYLAKEIDVNLSCDKIAAQNQEIDNLKFDFAIKASKDALRLIQKGDFKELMNYPFKSIAKLNVKDILKLGDLDAFMFLDVKNLKNVEEKLKNQKFDFVNRFIFELKIKDSLLQFFAKTNPQIELINQISKHKNGYAFFKLKIEKGKVSLNNE